MANVLNFYIVVSEFELQSRYYVHFQTYTVRKDMKPPYPHPDMSWIVPLLFFYNDDFGIK